MTWGELPFDLVKPILDRLPRDVLLMRLGEHVQQLRQQLRFGEREVARLRQPFGECLRLSLMEQIKKRAPLVPS